MNLLITGAWKWEQNQLDQILKLGHTVHFLQNETDPLPVPYDMVEGVICNGLFLHHPICQFTNLRYIQLTSAGFERVPMDEVEARGIRLHNARGVYSVPMAEFILCGVLQLYKQSRFFAENQRKHTWIKHRDLMELYGKKVCIIGCGSVGTECARRFRAFGCRVVGIDLFPREDGHYDEMYPLCRLDETIADADIVVLTLPLTKESRGLMNRQRLAHLKEGAVLVNAARGAVVETQALTDWLKQGRGAAVLDVFEEEPLPEESALWQLDNVIVTPHNSFVGEGNSERLFRVILENLSSI